ncbi:MAG: DNA replication/repair protein RecF [Acutalibacteraceae bacterium]|nr:DNA replication/repair protein RecF [Acutalibacteraceae bacterium]
MTVNSVKIKNFRNIADLSFTADNGVNVIYGENAQGKTNILESIWLFTGCKSFRGAKDNELIKFGEDFAKINLDFCDNSREKKSEITITDKKKNASLNGVSLRSTAELIGSFYAVIFSPVHLSLIKDGPSARRKFLDTALCQLKPSYAEHLAGYKRALVQRNALLKDLHLNSELYDMLDTWDDQLARYSALVIKERLQYVDLLFDYSKSIYSGISENKESFSVFYSKNICKDISVKDIYLSEIENLKNSRKEDILSKTSTVGPHRDDLEILINNVSARSFGSQGQQRSCALALKLGESEIIKKVTGETPVALLDDVMSELDEKRQDYVLNHINDRQVFLTCCDPSQVLRLCGGKSFLIKGGEII